MCTHIQEYDRTNFAFFTHTENSIISHWKYQYKVSKYASLWYILTQVYAIYHSVCISHITVSWLYDGCLQNLTKWFFKSCISWQILLALLDVDKPLYGEASRSLVSPYTIAWYPVKNIFSIKSRYSQQNTIWCLRLPSRDDKSSLYHKYKPSRLW